MNPCMSVHFSITDTTKKPQTAVTLCHRLHHCRTSWDVINDPIELKLHNCVSCCLDNTLNTPAWMDRQGSLLLCRTCVSSLTVGLLVGVEAACWDGCFERSAVVLECDAASELEEQVSDSWVFTSSNIQPIKFIPIITYSGIPLLLVPSEVW